MNVYEARHTGREYCCKTEGSDHYKEGGVEPLDLMIAKGLAEDFCIGNMSKYAFRFKKTRNLEDLKKVSDYAHILCGVELGKINEAERVDADKPATVEPWGDEDDKRQDKLFCDVGKCYEGCVFKEKANADELESCEYWCQANPAEARKIMDEMEGKKK